MKNNHAALLSILSGLALAVLAQSCSNKNNPTTPPAATNTPVITSTATKSPTNTPTSTSSLTPTSTATNTPTNSPTNTSTPSSTSTATFTPTVTFTWTNSSTATNSPTLTPTSTPTDSPTLTPTSTATDSPTVTPTSTATNSPTITETFTVTNTPTVTNTAVYPFKRNINCSLGGTGMSYIAVTGTSSVTLFGCDTSVAGLFHSWVGTDAGGFATDAPQTAAGSYYVWGLGMNPSGSTLFFSTTGSGAYYGYYSPASLPLVSPVTYAYGGSSPAGIAADASYVYIADNGTQKVYKYTTAGVSITSWGGYNVPAQVAVDTVNSVLYVANKGDNTVIKTSLTGSSPTTISLPTGLTFTTQAFGVAVDSSGNLFADDIGNGLIYKYSPSGTQLCSFGGFGAYPPPAGKLSVAQGLAVSANGYVYVADINAAHVAEFAPF